MKRPYEECPQFDRCNSNVCPLDPDVRDKFALPGDGVCRAEKPNRNRIGIKYRDLLPFEGLTRREWHGKRTWEGLDQAKKEKILQAGVKGLKPLQEGSLEARQEGVTTSV